MKLKSKFSAQEMGEVAQAVHMAEESVSDFFRLSDASWSRYPYEVRTLADLHPREVSSQALAQVLRLRRPPVAGSVRGRDFFRVCLQDHNLRSLIRREEDRDLLLPLLTYVTAHELVHVVRFYRFMHLYEADARQRRAEETKVHAITSQVLRKVRLPRLDKVLNLYEEHAIDGYGAAA